MANNYFLHPSNSTPCFNYIETINSLGYELIWVKFSFNKFWKCSYSNLNNYHHLEILGTSFSIPYELIVNKLPFLRNSNAIVIRTYLESTCPIISNYPEHVSNYVILGDTHHMPGQLQYSYTYLMHNHIKMLTSYANPADIILLRQLCNINPEKCFIYPPSLVISNTIDIATIQSMIVPVMRRNLFGLCSTTSLFQPYRTYVLNWLANSNSIVQNKLILHEFIESQVSLFEFFESIKAYIVPTNGGQISPTLLAAYNSGCYLLSNCFNQLTLHPEYKPIMQRYLPLELIFKDESILDKVLNANSHFRTHNSFTSFKEIKSEISFFLDPNKYFQLPQEICSALKINPINLRKSFLIIDNLLLANRKSPFSLLYDESYANIIRDEGLCLAKSFSWAHFN